MATEFKLQIRGVVSAGTMIVCGLAAPWRQCLFCSFAIRALSVQSYVSVLSFRLIFSAAFGWLVGFKSPPTAFTAGGAAHDLVQDPTP